MDTLSAPLRDEAWVAKKLHCQVKTLQAWRHRGGGPAFVKVGSLVRYRDEDVQQFIEANRLTSTSGRGKR